jgi:hypothetical protein
MTAAPVSRCMPPGILTAEGKITGPMLDTPDAAVFALIEREALAQGLFLAAYSQRRKTPGERAEMLRQHEAAREARQRLADPLIARQQGVISCVRRVSE